MASERPRWIDLHLHSTASDGAHPPAKVIEMAHARGLSAVALTDHDTVAGLDEAARAAASHDMEFIPGVELEAVHGGKRVHLLGYFIDAGYADLIKALDECVADRHARNRAIIEKLKAFGIDLDYDKVVQRNQPPGKSAVSIGRPHIADALVRLGVVSHFQQAFQKYLGNDRPAYVPRRTRSAAELIAVIRAASGVVSLAHPSRVPADSHLELATLVSGLCDAGLEAIEVIHSDHRPHQTRLYTEIARCYDLALTGGSDFHTLARIRQRGTGFGGIRAPYEWLDPLRARSRKKAPAAS